MALGPDEAFGLTEEHGFSSTFWRSFSTAMEL